MSCAANLLGRLLKSAHAVDREFRVIQALESTDVPVARALHLCADEDVIGAMFYLMSFVEGRIFWDPALPELRKSSARNLLPRADQRPCRHTRG